MSPFATYFSQQLRDRQLRARGIATASGVSPGFLSAVLTDRKSPSPACVERIGQALSLSSEERAALRDAAKLSVRRLEIPRGTAAAAYKVAHALMDRLARLTPVQLEAIRLIVELPVDREEPDPEQIT